MHVQLFSRVQLFETLWTVACQAPLSMGFSRQEEWSGCHSCLRELFPNPGIKLTSLSSPVLASRFLTTVPSGKPKYLPTCLYVKRASLVAQLIKNLPAMQETLFRFLGWEDPREKGLATYSSIHAWKIPVDRGAWQATVHRAAKSQT